MIVPSALFSLIALIGNIGVSAQLSHIKRGDFKHDHEALVRASAPAWHLDKKSCAPSDAMSSWMVQSAGNDPDKCSDDYLSNNCPGEPQQNGPHTESVPFPTYWMAHKCDDHSCADLHARSAQRRVLYDVYFTKDTWHKHDWEWAIIKWESAAGTDPEDESMLFFRTGIWLEQDGGKPFYPWDQLPSTFMGGSDIDYDGEQGCNHPKLYFEKWHHSVHDGPNYKVPPSGCWSGYANDDYRYDSSKWLVKWDVLPEDWNYGEADSKPSAFDHGAKYDLCAL